MYVYLAIIPHHVINPVINDMKFPQILNSFAHSKAYGQLTYRPNELTLDSGAFTAWNVGKTVDVAEYRTWAETIAKDFSNVRCINLDVIPGEKGRTSTAAERKIGMQKSVENADFLRENGLDVMEVFHQDEPLEYLDLLVKRLPSKESVLCISPRNDVSLKAKLQWHQLVLKHLVDTLGKDNLPRMHGLAVTARTLMLAFPYFSVDSSSYSSPVRWGTVADEDGKMMRNAEWLGFNPPNNDHRGYSLLIRQHIESYIRLEIEATTVWKQRGIVWN